MDDLGIDKTIGANIQRYRAARGLSQADLAEQVGRWMGEQVHQQTIQKIEKGSRTLKFTEAIAMTVALSVDLEDLAVAEHEARRRANLLLHVARVEAMHDELRDFAERLAPMLVSLAVTEAVQREVGEADSHVETPEEEQLGRRQLLVNWGRDLNDALLLALRKQPYLADIKPELAAPTYTEILRRVAESPIGWPKLDDSDS